MFYQDFRLTEEKVILVETLIIDFECIINMFYISLVFFIGLVVKKCLSPLNNTLRDIVMGIEKWLLV